MLSRSNQLGIIIANFYCRQFMCFAKAFNSSPISTESSSIQSSSFMKYECNSIDSTVIVMRSIFPFDRKRKLPCKRKAEIAKNKRFIDLWRLILNANQFIVPIQTSFNFAGQPFFVNFQFNEGKIPFCFKLLCHVNVCVLTAITFVSDAYGVFVWWNRKWLAFVLSKRSPR